MLFGYPIEAVAENWLHKCLEQILQSIHNNSASGNTIIDFSEAISEPYQGRLKRRLRISNKPNSKVSTFGDKINRYQIVLRNLTVPEQEQVLRAFNDQNNIALLLSGECTCQSITELPKPIRDPIKSLFEAAFELLTDLEIRDQHYQVIYERASHHVCPFCGCEYFDAPGARREALDHYLPKHKYPFAAANLRNLVPMGHKCNSGYKLDQDVLAEDNGRRRRSFDPYSHTRVTVSLNNSQPFAGTVGKTGEQLPRWEIDFSPNSEEVATWNTVFHIQERYRRDVLDPAFNNWMSGFRSWCRDPRKGIPKSDEEWIDSIDRYAFYYESLGYEDRAFLKAALFRMLHIHCKNGNQRLVEFIKNVVTGVS